MFNLLCERAGQCSRWPPAAPCTGAVGRGSQHGTDAPAQLVAVIRSTVSLCLLYQQLAQYEPFYDKHAETILGSMDSVVFLGGREASTIKEISENWLGKATISMQTDSRSRGQSS